MSTIIWFIFTFWIPCFVLISIATLKVRPKSNCPIKNHSKIMSEMKNWGNYISWKQSNPQTSDRQPLWQTWYIGQKIPLKIQLNINYMLTFLLQFCIMWNKCVVWCQKLSFSEFWDTKRVISNAYRHYSKGKRLTYNYHESWRETYHGNANIYQI